MVVTQVDVGLAGVLVSVVLAIWAGGRKLGSIETKIDDLLASRDEQKKASDTMNIILTDHEAKLRVLEAVRQGKSTRQPAI